MAPSKEVADELGDVVGHPVDRRCRAPVPDERAGHRAATATWTRTAAGAGCCGVMPLKYCSLTIRPPRTAMKPSVYDWAR